MVEIEKIPKPPPMPPRPWFRLDIEPKYITGKREEAIRAYAELEGFKDLRGYWRHMESEGWDYYDIIRMSYQ